MFNRKLKFKMETKQENNAFEVLVSMDGSRLTREVECVRECHANLDFLGRRFIQLVNTIGEPNGDFYGYRVVISDKLAKDLYNAVYVACMFVEDLLEGRIRGCELYSQDGCRTQNFLLLHTKCISSDGVDGLQYPKYTYKGGLLLDESKNEKICLNENSIDFIQIQKI